MEAQIKLQYAFLLWMIAIFLVAIVMYSLVNYEFKKKYGCSKSELKHYRKLMTDSAYRAENKKGSAKANPSKFN
jgi:ABC-type spermidine/putrescine transport system permease subunit I